MNTKFFIDAINKPFVRYSVLHGTKYRLNRCGLLVAGTGALAGVGVYAMADKPVKRYLIPSAVAVGSASMLLLLTKNNYSLKNKIVSRGVEHVKDIIEKQVAGDLIKKNYSYKTANKYLEYLNKQPILTNNSNELAIIDKKFADFRLKYDTYNRTFENEMYNLSSAENLKELTNLLYAFVNNILNEKITTESFIQKQDNAVTRLNPRTLTLNYYQEALIHTNVFIYKSLLDLNNQRVFFKKLDLLPEKEKICIKTIAFAIMRVNRKKYHDHLKKLTIHDIIQINLANLYTLKASCFRNNTENMCLTYQLNINDNNSIEFLEPENLLHYLPN